MDCIAQEHGKNWSMYWGDCCEVIKGLPDDSIDFCIHSPPFSSLYIYSDSEADMGNALSDEEFIRHYEFLISELFRVTVPGRLCAIHVKDLPKYLNRDGTAGLIDFPGMCISAFENHGWAFHSRVTIWKCPVTERERTNNHGLLHKSILKDSSGVRQGMADYLIVFRKPSGTMLSAKPVERPQGLTRYIGDQQFHPLKSDFHPSPYARTGKPDVDINGVQDPIQSSICIWRRYAEPVWWDIDQTNVLNYKAGRDEKDERHLCVARGSLVVTQDGHIPIQDVLVGDMVLTHKGRWRQVLAKKCNGIRHVVQVKAQGVPLLKVTPDHKIWTRLGIGKGRWPGSPGSTQHPRSAAKKNDPVWIEASQTKSHYVNLKLPPIEESEYSVHDWWVVGRWLGDGHIGPRNSVIISCSHEETEGLTESLGEYAGFSSSTGTATQIRIKDPTGRLRSLLSKFGRKAHGKRLPREALCLDPVRSAALLSGYLSADGHWNERYQRWMGSSVSRALLLGMSMVAQRVHGVVSAVYGGRLGGLGEIQGRIVSVNDDWIFSIPPKNLSGMVLEDGGWKKVREVIPAGDEEVWDLQIEEDESFTVEGCIVHNCPLQLDVIERAVDLWTNPGDVVLTPFGGVGSELIGSIRLDRKAIGIELKESYFKQACKNLRIEESKIEAPKLDFDFDKDPLASLSVE